MDFSDKSDAIKRKLGILRNNVYRSTKAKLELADVKRVDAVKVMPKKPKRTKKIVLTKKQQIHRNNN